MTAEERAKLHMADCPGCTVDTSAATGITA